MRRTDLIAVVIIFVLIIVSVVNIINSDSSKNDFADKIAVIPVKGVILDSEKFIKILNEYGEKSSVKGIILNINSPGGGTTASQEMYFAVKKAKERYGKPIYTSMGTVAASGGYYLALATDSIFAAPSTITGSIGVIMDFPQWTQVMEKVGFRLNVIKSGEFKDAGSPYREFSLRDQQYFQNLVDNVYDQFLQVVADERKMDIAEVRTLSGGQVYTGTMAKDNGLIDAIGTLQDVISAMGEDTGLGSHPKILQPKEKKVTLWDLVFGDTESMINQLVPSPELQYIYR